MRCTAASAAVVAAVVLLTLALVPPANNGPGPQPVVAQDEEPKPFSPDEDSFGAPATITSDEDTIGPETIDSNGVPAIPGVSSVEQQAVAALDEKLNKVVPVEFVDMPMREVVRIIADQIEADMVIDEAALTEENISPDDPVSLRLTRTPVTAKTALKFLLEPLQLTTINRSGVIYVTTIFVADETTTIRVYDVRDLLETSKAVRDIARERADFLDSIAIEASGEALALQQQKLLAEWAYKQTGEGQLVHLIQQTTGIGTWFEIDNGNGYIMPFNGLLVVRQTEMVHTEIQKLLDTIRNIGPPEGDAEKIEPTPAKKGGPYREPDDGFQRKEPVKPKGDTFGTPPKDDGFTQPVPKQPVEPKNDQFPSADTGEQHLRSSVRLSPLVHNENTVGSGMVIDSGDDTLFVLTCWHLFREVGDGARVRAELYPSGPREPPIPANGRVIAHDEKADLALVRLDKLPDGLGGVIEIPVVSVADADQTVKPGELVYSIGYGEAEIPTKQRHEITRINPFEGPATIECTGNPPVGRSGAGLFAENGKLIGVCFAADRDDQRGVYVGLAEIHKLLGTIRNTGEAPPVIDLVPSHEESGEPTDDGFSNPSPPDSDKKADKDTGFSNSTPFYAED